MSNLIRILPDSLANQIAAGEVIQRPSSVVKELVENAIDADAKEITINIKDAGRTLIQVIDNGKGMNSDDARLSFERHATSKIQSAEDLFCINTKGFRGEALASIAAVAKVELKTKLQDEDLGTFIEIEASKIQKIEPINCPQGSNFAVKNLFYNIPARRKFLKSERTEFINILSEFYRIAIPYPNIAFTLIHNDDIVKKLIPETLKERINNIFDKNLNKQLITINADGGFIKISGFIGDPSFSVKRNPKQYFFVNNRFMKNYYFHKAVMLGYQQLLQADTKPNYFIFFDIDSDKIDVNIHPTKTEINFENSNAIFQILQATVRKGLTEFDVPPAIDFDNSDLFLNNFDNKNKEVKAPKIKLNPNYIPFENMQKEIEFHSKIDQNKELDLDPFSEDVYSKAFDNEEIVEKNNEPKFIQLHKKFIITTIKSGLMIIDLQRALKQIRYEEILKKLEQNTSSISTIYPVNVGFSSDEILFFDEIKPKLEESGFKFEKINNLSYNISGIPPFIELSSASQIIKDLVKISQVSDNELNQLDYRDIAENIVNSSKDNFIPENLREKNMQDIVNKLMACHSPQYSYDGKSIITMISFSEIDDMFKE